MNMGFSLDNQGNLVPAAPELCAPVAASGQTVATGTAGDDKTFTVVAGASYSIVGQGTGILASITGVTSTAANIEWSIPLDTIAVIKIPEGKTTLYLEGTVSTKNVHIAKLADRVST